MPHRPGVYRMIGPSGEVLYVGKSVRVRTRLLSYFRARARREGGGDHRPRAPASSGTTSRASSRRCCTSSGRSSAGGPLYNVEHKRDRAYCFIKRHARGGAASCSLVGARGRRTARLYFGPFRGRARVRGGDARAVRPARAARLPRPTTTDALRRPARALPRRGRRRAAIAARSAAASRRAPAAARARSTWRASTWRCRSWRATPTRRSLILRERMAQAARAAPVRVRRGAARPRRAARARARRAPRAARHASSRCHSSTRCPAGGRGPHLPDAARAGARGACPRPEHAGGPGGARRAGALTLLAPEPRRLGLARTRSRRRSCSSRAGSACTPRSGSRLLDPAEFLEPADRLILAPILHRRGWRVVDPWQDRCVMPGHSPAPAALLLLAWALVAGCTDREPPPTPLRSWGPGAGSAPSAGLRGSVPHRTTKETRGSCTSTATATSRSTKETPYGPGSGTGSLRCGIPPARRRAPGSTTRTAPASPSPPASRGRSCGGAAATRCTWKIRAASATNTRSSGSNEPGPSREQADHQSVDENRAEERQGRRRATRQAAMRDAAAEVQFSAARRSSRGPPPSRRRRPPWPRHRPPHGPRRTEPASMKAALTTSRLSSGVIRRATSRATRSSASNHAVAAEKGWSGASIRRLRSWSRNCRRRPGQVGRSVPRGAAQSGSRETFRVDVRQRENRDARREAEAQGPRGPRIHDQDAVYVLHARPVGVAVDDHVGTRVRGDECGRRGRAELMPVDHKDPAPLQLDLDGLRDARPQIEAVGVAPDGGDGRDGLELDQDVRRAHVARVEDPLDALAALEDLGPQLSVRVADQPDVQIVRLRLRLRRSASAARSVRSTPTCDSARATTKSTSSPIVERAVVEARRCGQHDRAGARRGVACSRGG